MPSTILDSYLTPLPRGLHHVAMEGIAKQLDGYQMTMKALAEPIDDEAAYLSYLSQRLKDKRTGSIYDENFLKKHVSVGYWRDTQPIWCMAGLWEGCVWIRIDTNAPPDLVSRIDVIGPLLAIAHVWDLADAEESPLRRDILDEAVQHINQLLCSPAYSLETAIDLWIRHAKTWKDYSFDPKSLRYRASCLRLDTKTYAYPREDLVRGIVDNLVVPPQPNWKVNLTQYDLEVLVLLLSPTCVVVGISLRPYHLLGIQGFTNCTRMPSDLSPPFMVAHGITRLRPTNARILIELANVKPGDVLLDPCAGMGTIPYLSSPGSVGLGGDVDIVQGTMLRSAMLDYEQRYRQQNISTNMAAWDAACLPIRSQTIDVIVSDLPFGKQCLSSKKLFQLIPLWFHEMARVLRRASGRIVLLCGSVGRVIEALTYFHDPSQQEPQTANTNWCISATFPVTITGLSAWVVVARRTNSEFFPLPMYTTKLQKLTAQRCNLQRMGQGTNRQREKRKLATRK